MPLSAPSPTIPFFCVVVAVSSSRNGNEAAWEIQSCSRSAIPLRCCASDSVAYERSISMPPWESLSVKKNQMMQGTKDKMDVEDEDRPRYPDHWEEDYNTRNSDEEFHESRVRPPSDISTDSEVAVFNAGILHREGDLTTEEYMKIVCKKTRQQISFSEWQKKQEDEYYAALAAKSGASSSS